MVLIAAGQLRMELLDQRKCYMPSFNLQCSVCYSQRFLVRSPMHSCVPGAWAVDLPILMLPLQRACEIEVWLAGPCGWHMGGSNLCLARRSAARPCGRSGFASVAELLRHRGHATPAASIARSALREGQG